MLDSFLLSLALTTSNGQFSPKQVTQNLIAHKAKSGCLAQGTLSYYDSWYAGRRTASGETYEPSGYTVALVDWLPFGEYTLTNLDNGRSVTVWGNDRGAFGHMGRVADASEVVFRSLSPSGTLNEGLLFNVCIN